LFVTLTHSRLASINKVLFSLLDFFITWRVESSEVEDS